MLVSKIKAIRNGRVITKDATPTKQELDDRIQSLIQAIDNAHKSGDQNAYFENQKSLEKVKEQRKQLYGDSKTKDLNLLPEEVVRIVMKKAGVSKSIAERAVSKLLESGEVSAGLSDTDILKKAQPFLPTKDARTFTNYKGYEISQMDNYMTVVWKGGRQLKPFKGGDENALNQAKQWIDYITTYENSASTTDANKEFNYKGYIIEEVSSTEYVLYFESKQKGVLGRYPSLAKAQQAADERIGWSKYYLKRVDKVLRGEDSKDAIDPTKPKNIAAAKSLSVAQGKAATGDKKSKDAENYKGYIIKWDNGKEMFIAYEKGHWWGESKDLEWLKREIDLEEKQKPKDAKPIKRHLVRAKDEDKVGDWKNRVLGTMKKIYELQGEEDLYTLCNKAISQIRVPEVFRNEIYTDITGHWNASKNFILGR